MCDCNINHFLFCYIVLDYWNEYEAVYNNLKAHHSFNNVEKDGVAYCSELRTTTVVSGELLLPVYRVRVLRSKWIRLLLMSQSLRSQRSLSEAVPTG